MVAISMPACIASEASSCGRPNLEDAIAHAQQRAATLGRRQHVFVQRHAWGGASSTYFTIRSA